MDGGWAAGAHVQHTSPPEAEPRIWNSTQKSLLVENRYQSDARGTIGHAKSSFAAAYCGIQKCDMFVSPWRRCCSLPVSLAAVGRVPQVHVRDETCSHTSIVPSTYSDEVGSILVLMEALVQASRFKLSVLYTS